MKNHTEALRNLRDGVSTLGNLRDRITLELITEIARPHYGLLASNLGKKVSRNLGAIQTSHTTMAGIEVVNMIRKDSSCPNHVPFESSAD